MIRAEHPTGGILELCASDTVAAYSHPRHRSLAIYCAPSHLLTFAAPTASGFK